MKIFLTGATGAIGRPLLRMLIERGHSVTATTRDVSKLKALQAEGATAVQMDGLNEPEVHHAILAARPDVVVHQMTALADVRNYKNFDKEFGPTNKLRTDGTKFLLQAAIQAGAQRFIAQSYLGWPFERVGGRVKSEDDPLDPNPPKTMSQSLDAIKTVEQIVPGARALRGIVLRYGSLYGPGTAFAPGGPLVELVRKRQFPVIGSGAGVWSFLHVEDAAIATCSAIEKGEAGIYNIADDEPSEVRIWLPEMARMLGAAAPRHIPAWLGRLVAGESAVVMMTASRGASNRKAKELLGWTPRYPTWRISLKESFTGAATTMETGPLPSGSRMR